jgi:hypothetical protein
MRLAGSTVRRPAIREAQSRDTRSGSWYSPETMSSSFANGNLPTANAYSTTPRLQQSACIVFSGPVSAWIRYIVSKSFQEHTAGP